MSRRRGTRIRRLPDSREHISKFTKLRLKKIRNKKRPCQRISVLRTVLYFFYIIHFFLITTTADIIIITAAIVAVITPYTPVLSFPPSDAASSSNSIFTLTKQSDLTSENWTLPGQTTITDLTIKEISDAVLDPNNTDTGIYGTECLTLAYEYSSITNVYDYDTVSGQWILTSHMDTLP